MKTILKPLAIAAMLIAMLVPAPAFALDMPKDITHEWCQSEDASEQSAIYIACKAGEFTVARKSFGWEDTTCTPLAVRVEENKARSQSWIVQARCKDYGANATKVETFRFYLHKGTTLILDFLSKRTGA